MMVRLLESLGILLFTFLLGLSFKHLAASSLLQALVCSLIVGPFAYLCADFLSGFIHWVCDSFGCSTTPVWGPLVVAPFRRHHQNPWQITEISLVENLGSSAIVGSFVLLLLGLRPLSEASWGLFLLQSFWLWLVIFAVLSNLFHRWSHLPLPRKPLWMLRLQKFHLILNSEDHLEHHRKPYRINYCILCGWANPLTNRIPWHRVESFLATFGIKTNFD